MLQILRAGLLGSRASCYPMLRLLSSSSDFEAAQMNLSNLKDEPEISTKLELYGLFKQATIGNATGKRPGAFDIARRAKYDKWKTMEGMSQEEAQQKYTKLVNDLLIKQGSVEENISTIAGLPAVPGLKLSIENKIFRIHLNRPEKFNALTYEMYDGITEALHFASKDLSTSVTVFSASGQYYCSGNDLSNFTKIKGPEGFAQMAEIGSKILEKFVSAFITHEKPLIAFVNGPAIGIPVTVLGLFDLVLASDKATFHTPFSSLGQSPEGCSSYTFPMLMGPVMAAEFLVFGRKLTATEAMERGLVNEVFSSDVFQTETMKRIETYSKLPPESLRINKGILRHLHKEALMECNRREVDLLAKRWLSNECFEAIQKFITRK